LSRWTSCGSFGLFLLAATAPRRSRLLRTIGQSTCQRLVARTAVRLAHGVAQLGDQAGVGVVEPLGEAAPLGQHVLRLAHVADVAGAAGLAERGAGLDVHLEPAADRLMAAMARRRWLQAGQPVARLTEAASIVAADPPGVLGDRVGVARAGVLDERADLSDELAAVLGVARDQRLERDQV